MLFNNSVDVYNQKINILDDFFKNIGHLKLNDKRNLIKRAYKLNRKVRKLDPRGKAFDRITSID